MLLFQQADFLDRNNLPEKLNQMGLTGVGVEIGTHRGDYAKILLEKWSGKKLICIDPWKNPPKYEEQAKLLWGDGNRDHDHTEAVNQLQLWKDRVEFCRMCSHQALSLFEDESLDFVYVDGDHSYEEVLFDLTEWFKKLKRGGVIAGHDIVSPGEAPDSLHNWGKQIQPAVIEFAYLHKLTINLIVESQCLPWSYYLVKE